MGVVVTAIQFNTDPLVKRRSALNVRRNASSFNPFPEWQRTVTETAGESVAAYAIRQVGGGDDLVIRASFTRTDPSLRSVEVRAIQAPRPEFPWWLFPLPAPPQLASLDPYGFYLYVYAYRLWLIWIASGGNVLGEVRPRRVEFEPDGTTGLLPFRLENVRLRDRGVGVHDVAWLWQYRTGPEQPWTDMDVTRHRIYALLDLPTAPWNPFPVDPASISLPWTEAMEVGCAWAAGSHTPAAIAARITEGLWALGGELFEYGCPIGALETYANTPLDFFNCTAFLDRLKGGLGNGRYINCTDCASMVTTLTNLLGCDLWQARMGMYTPSFQTAPILAIGTSVWQSPCGLGLGFSYHEVAWEGACTAFDPVWDACLQVNARWPYSTIPLPELPVGMRFGFVGGSGYRSKLAATYVDEAICEPRPWERRRRNVV